MGLIRIVRATAKRVRCRVVLPRTIDSPEVELRQLFRLSYLPPRQRFRRYDRLEVRIVRKEFYLVPSTLKVVAEGLKSLYYS